MATTKRIGPETGRLLLRTGRGGLAAQAGHDLVIEVTRWSGELTLAAERTDSTLEVTVETGSLRVVEGKGGAIALSEKDKREIAATTRKILAADRHPEARFTSTSIVSDVVQGTLTIVGRDRPFRLNVTEVGENRFRGTGIVVQTDYGIKPHTAMLGALKVADPVEVDVEIDLS